MNFFLSDKNMEKHRIDPEINAFIEQTKAAHEALTGGRPVSPQRRRDVAEQVREQWRQGGPKMAQTHTLYLDDNSLKARIYIPQTGCERGTLLYLHGGGWAMFSIDTHDRLMREYAHRAGCAVVGLDYSLSPEHKFPQALNDIDRTYDWVSQSALEFGLVMRKLIIGGDSAGGNLALASTLRRRDQNQSMPSGLLLNYAAVDTQVRASHHLFGGESYMLSAEEMAAFWQDYLGANSTQNPYARPLLGDFTGLPPVHLCIAECDILVDENLVLRDRLRATGVDVSAVVYERATHSFLEAMSVSACARQAIQDSSQWIDRQLENE